MGCKYKTTLDAFLCIQFGNGAEKPVAKAVFQTGLLDDQHLSGMKIAGRLAIIPFEGRDGGLVFAGYAVKGVSATDLVHTLLAGPAGAHGLGLPLGGGGSALGRGLRGGRRMSGMRRPNLGGGFRAAARGCTGLGLGITGSG